MASLEANQAAMNLAYFVKQIVRNRRAEVVYDQDREMLWITFADGSHLEFPIPAVFAEDDTLPQENSVWRYLFEMITRQPVNNIGCGD